MRASFPQGVAIFDREALLVTLRQSNIHHAERTIRYHCRVIGYAPDGRALYDVEECVRVLAKVPTRRKRRG